MVKDYILRLTKITSIYRVHSPFVYDFCTKVLPFSRSESGHKIEKYRAELMQNETPLTWTDLGAGFKNEGGKVQAKSVATIARSSARRRREGELLHRICRHYKPQRLLEFGTNLGISALYQYSAVPQSKMLTMEGAPEIAAFAAKGFDILGLKPEIITGEFGETLRRFNNFADFRPDYVFIDGNHQYEATLNYATALIPNMEEGGILILDDIYWSQGMKKAWKEIKNHPDITLTIDLYTFGICFVRKKQAKSHFHFFFRNF